MKKVFVLPLFLLVAMWTMAQNVPYWVAKIPTATNETYYFRVTQAAEPTYEQAYARAFAMAIMESSWKMGVAVDAKNDMTTIERGIADSLNVRSHSSNIAINKVCEYTERDVMSDKVRIYVLWQVAASGNINPQFDFFNKCR